MNLFRSSVKSSRWIESNHTNQRLRSLLPKVFSTEAEAEKQTDAINSFVQKPSSGLCYGRIQNITKYTTRRDVCNLLARCNLNLDDLRVDYDRNFLPTSMLVRFPSRDAYEVGLRATRVVRVHKLNMVDRSAWDFVKPYEARYILLQGLPPNAFIDDVERFLSGCQYESSTFHFFSRAASPDLIRMATVSFPSQALAMHACITKDRGFCLNNQISVRVLQ
ncbi:hypothetical protein LIER_19397 [Lithospermum erythrorhizon]|uniref:Uncharacterized protein n=1 Tax=Lithospermum erythrorhizon TaxID=34254 RepID=A0AAV3QHJ5_LITER